jgi:glycosyltransferase involved in cell wall biosynthesis
MDILFVHGNYPAQFRAQARAVAADPAHRVVYATEREPVPEVKVFPGLRLVHYRPHRPPSAAIHPYLGASENDVLLGQAVARCLQELQREGFQPRLVIFHAGRGLGLFLRPLLPQATLVAYCEWYFKPADLPWLKGRSEVNAALAIGLRNGALLLEMAAADLAVVPTDWQRQQFPPAIQGQLQVLFDGIDTDSFRPPPPGAPRRELILQPEGGSAPLRLGPEAVVLSYATRGMEPLRGFPEFLRALPPLLQAMPALEVVVAGRDRQAYSYPAPSHEGSWKQHLLAELGPFEGRERVHFTGLIPYGQLRDLYQRTDLHVYFSRPYVTSWSLFEAAACGAPILMNSGAATTGVLPGAAFATVDLDAPATIPAAIQAALERSLQARGLPRRSLLPPELALQPCLERWQHGVNAAVRRSQQRTVATP